MQTRSLALRFAAGLIPAALALTNAGAAPDPGGAARLASPILVQDGRAAIDVEVGHAAPFLVDWDGDGKPDLLVGQFGNGLLRFYPNRGTAAKPRFEGFSLVQAGGANARVPSG